MTQIPRLDAITIADLYRDPATIYTRLRHEAPVAFIPATGRVFITRAADLRHVKESPALFTAEDTTTPADRTFQATTMMRKDGAQHRAERMALAPGLSAGRIKTTWRELAEALAARHLDRFTPGDTADLFTDLAGPYSAALLGHVLGLDGARPADILRWSQAIIDGAGNVADDPGVWARSDAMNREVNALIDRNLARFRQTPDDSVLSAMAHADNPIPLARIRCNVKVAIGGGVNEPRDAFLTTVFALLTHPEQLKAARADPALMARAFEEAIRWVAPIQFSPRKPLQAVTLSGVDLPAGTRLSVIQASANWDETIYDHPERFDIHRAETRHFSFGNGAHFCMGAHLARMSVAQVLLPALFDRFPGLSLPDPGGVKWHGFTFRGPLGLPVRF